MEKPLAGSNPMLHFRIRTPSTGVRPPTTLFHGLVGVLCDRVGERVVRNAMAYPFGKYQGVGSQWPNRGLQ